MHIFVNENQARQGLESQSTRLAWPRQKGVKGVAYRRFDFNDTFSVYTIGRYNQNAYLKLDL